MDRPTFKVTRVAACRPENHCTVLEPRTDIDMTFQQAEARARAAQHNTTEVASDGPLAMADHGVSRWGHRAMLIQLVHEAHRYQKEQLARLHLNTEDNRGPQREGVLTNTNVKELIAEIDLLMDPFCSCENYGIILHRLCALLLFIPSYKLKETRSVLNRMVLLL